MKDIVSEIRKPFHEIDDDIWFLAKEAADEITRLRAALRSAIWVIEHSGNWEAHRMDPMPEGNTVQDHVDGYRALLVQENKRVCTCTEPREACSNCETRTAALKESSDAPLTIISGEDWA